MSSQSIDMDLERLAETLESNTVLDDGAFLDGFIHHYLEEQRIEREEASRLHAIWDDSLAQFEPPEV